MWLSGKHLICFKTSLKFYIRKHKFKYNILLYANTTFYSMQMQHFVLCKYNVLFYANTAFYSMQIQHSVLCKYNVLIYANTTFYSMQAQKRKLTSVFTKIIIQHCNKCQNNKKRSLYL